MSERILLTGASGFIGRNLLPALRDEGYEIYCITREDSFSPGFEEYLRAAGIRARAIKCDLTDPRQVGRAVSRVSPDAAIHMAALASVGASWSRGMWKKYMEVNYFGTVNLVNALSKLRDFRLLIHYSTPEVFKEQPAECAEDSPVYPASPYAISKAAAEFYVVSCCDVPAAVVRPANTYDRSALRDNLEEARKYFVEKAVIDLLTKGRVSFDGSPETVRTWMHVSDHVSAIKLLLSRGIDSGLEGRRVFNIAPPDGTRSCGEMFGAILAALRELGAISGEVEVTWNNRPRPRDPRVLAVDGRKFREEFPQWKPLPLMAGVRRTAENWIRALGRG
ncbi:MAG: NAD-dependent epimerase/dehydratase family protein [Nitrososphaerota archaeon]